MEDFQGKYNGKQIDQLLDKANDIDLTKYALKTDNAPTATKLQAARAIALSGAVTGSVSSDFGSNVTISTTLANFDASKIASGTISIDRLPKAALERLIVVADDTARFALTTATAQSGDTVKVTSTGKMYLIKDESKLSSEDGYEPYTASQASSVPWSGVTGKPSTFAPPTSSATVLGGIKEDTDILYEVIQQHTLSEEWEPGLNTASLYKVIDKEHAGTIGDPIPYFPPMEIFKDKYYIQNADVYKCTRDSGTPLSHNLQDLIGLYVERV